jgi:hypothetical protein
MPLSKEATAPKTSDIYFLKPTLKIFIKSNNYAVYPLKMPNSPFRGRIKALTIFRLWGV